MFYSLHIGNSTKTHDIIFDGMTGIVDRKQLSHTWRHHTQ